MGITEDVFQMKGMQSSERIEDVKKKIHARVGKVLYHEISNFVLDDERLEVAARSSAGGRESKTMTETPQARGLAECK